MTELEPVDNGLDGAGYVGGELVAAGRDDVSSAAFDAADDLVHDDLDRDELPQPGVVVPDPH